MTYRFEPNDLELDEHAWSGDVIDSNGHVVLETWNNGDDGGNFYIWHDYEVMWAIEADAIATYKTDRPLDDWIEDLRNG